jgi:hypothetical protein
MTTLYRLFFFFVIVIPCAGFSALQWMYRYIFSRLSMNEQDNARTSRFFGIPWAGSGRPTFVVPTSAPAWERLHSGDDTNDIRPYAFHLIKDIMSEWIKDDNQRAGKVLSFIIMLFFLLLVLETIVFGLFIFLLPGASASETLGYLFSSSPSYEQFIASQVPDYDFNITTSSR